MNGLTEILARLVLIEKCQGWKPLKTFTCREKEILEKVDVKGTS
jgi:hypothetical protein